VWLVVSILLCLLILFTGSTRQRESVRLLLLITRIKREFNAVSGAVGCSLLAYIIPCMLDLKLQGRDMPVMLIIKDSAIIAFAIFASVSGLVIIMMTVISGKKPT